MEFPVQNAQNSQFLREARSSKRLFLFCILFFIIKNKTDTIRKANVNNDGSAWLSLMVYLGGFTFDPEDPCEKLRVPNLIAAERFAHSVLPRFVGEMDSLKAAFETCILTGDVLGPLKHFQKLMCQIDIHYKHFEHGEDIHRNRFCCCTNFYPYLIDPVPEFSIDQVRVF